MNIAEKKAGPENMKLRWDLNFHPCCLLSRQNHVSNIPEPVRAEVRNNTSTRTNSSGGVVDLLGEQLEVSWSTVTTRRQLYRAQATSYTV